MKNIFFTLTLLLTFLSCDTEVKNESQTGIIEGGDAKSLVMDAFNDAYLANEVKCVCIILNYYLVIK